MKQLSFYERMKIDEMMRDSKAAAAEAERAKVDRTGLEDEDSDEDDEEEAAMDEQTPQERERHRRVKRLATTLKIPYDKAAVIDEMTASKGIQAATLGLESEDEEWTMTAATGAAATSKAAEELQKFD